MVKVVSLTQPVNSNYGTIHGSTRADVVLDLQ